MRRGHTLLEVMVVAGLSAAMLGVVLFSWVTMNGNSRRQNARIDARQSARTAVAVLRSQLQAASVVFPGTTSFGGQTYRVPAAGASPGPGDLLFAVPEGGAPGQMHWSICGLFLAPHEPFEANNPDAQDFVEQLAQDVGPVSHDDPEELRPLLAGLTTYGTRRFQAYVQADSLKLAVRPTPTSVFVQFAFSLVANDVAQGARPVPMHESYQTEIFLRNQAPPHR